LYLRAGHAHSLA